MSSAFTHLVRDGATALLIDAGSGAVLDHLAEIGVEQIEWVLHTHHHRDQCQGDPRLAPSTGLRVQGPARPRGSQLDRAPTLIGVLASTGSCRGMRPPGIAIPRGWDNSTTSAADERRIAPHDSDQARGRLETSGLVLWMTSSVDGFPPGGNDAVLRP